MQEDGKSLCASGPTAVDQAGQDKLKQKLAELGIPVYEGAEFFEIRKKSKDSALLYAVYLIPGETRKSLLM